MGDCNSVFGASDERVTDKDESGEVQEVGQILETNNSAVMVHVYDLGQSRKVQYTNKMFKLLGTGAFHAGVEVYGLEWSYGGADSGTGIFQAPPKTSETHHFRESIPMGRTPRSPTDVRKIITQMGKAWLGTEYDMLRKNCCYFADDFCWQLGVGNIPNWILNLAGAGATIANGIHAAKDKAQTMGMVAAAKAGQIGEKYQGRSQACMMELEECCGGRAKDSIEQDSMTWQSLQGNWISVAEGAHCAISADGRVVIGEVNAGSLVTVRGEIRIGNFQLVQSRSNRSKITWQSGHEIHVWERVGDEQLEAASRGTPSALANRTH